MNLAELQKQIGIDLVKDADDLETIEGEYEFQMYTRDASGAPTMLKAWVEKDEESGEDEMYISGIASSTIKDLHGDTMLPSALIDMERQANDNLTIFLNHEYKVPRDIAGSVAKASIQSSATDPETGAPIYDLSFEKIRINKENASAVETFRTLKPKGKTPGVKLGLSIGARIPEGGAIRNKKTGALLISHVQLLETSIVSLPANPRSWITNAVKSLRAGPTPDSQKSRIESVELEPLEPVVAIAAALEPVVFDSTSATQTIDTQTITVGEDGPEIIESAPDTTAPSQGTPESEPEADGTAAETVEAAAEPPTPGQIAALGQALDKLSSLTVDLIQARSDQATAEQRASKAEADLETVKSMAQDVIRDTAQIIDRLGRLPIGQKASFKAIQRDFDALPEGLEQIYSPAFMEELRKGKTE